LWIESFIYLIVVLRIQVSTQLFQVLKLTVPDVMAENCQEHFLIVGTMGDRFDKVDVPMLWALSAEILWPAEENKPTHFVQNAMGLFEFPAIGNTVFKVLGKSLLEGLQHFNRFLLQKIQLEGSHTELPWLHIPFQHGHMRLHDALHWIINQRSAMQIASLCIANFVDDNINLQESRPD
jgi:hypothetical protein